jgi:ABC-type nitrate/sulfonate/bicarbonate transport system substrate-binding protein
MNSRARLLLTIALPVLLVIVIVSVFVMQQRTPSTTTITPGTPTKLTHMTLALDWTPNTNHTGIYVALAKGWYRDQGIDLQLLPYSSSVNPDTLVSTGKADVGISSTESVVADYAVGQPVVSIAAILQHNTSALVVRADSGITSPRGLDGKTYGGFGAPYESAVVSAIIKHSGGTGKFKNVTLNIDSIEALKSKQIDFVWIYQGWEGIQAQREGLKLNEFYITDNGIPDYYTPTIIAGPNEIKLKSDLLKRFMVATARGYEFARSNVKESAQILLDQNKGVFPDSGLVFASQDYLSPRYADPGHKWGLQDAAAWHGYPNFMLSAGAVQDAEGKPIKSINFDQLYSNQFLPA